MGRGRGPRKPPGALAYIRCPDPWRENEDASPPALRPVKPLCWRHLQSLPHTLCLLPKPLDPEDSQPSRCLSRQSPLRSVGCTAAPEGQTKFGFGKRARGVILEILGWCTEEGSRVSLVCPEVGRRPLAAPTRWAACAQPFPQKQRPGRRGEPLEEKGSQKLNLPRPKSQRPDPGESRTQTPPTKFQRSPRRPGRLSEPSRERKRVRE